MSRCRSQSRVAGDCRRGPLLRRDAHCGTQTPAPGTTLLKSIFSPGESTRIWQPTRLVVKSNVLPDTIAAGELCSSMPKFKSENRPQSLLVGRER